MRRRFFPAVHVSEVQLLGSRTLPSKIEKLKFSHARPGSFGTSAPDACCASAACPSRLWQIGGSSLMLLGLINRPTRDLDLAALVWQGKYVKADPLPADLAEAARDVANALGLPANWLNAGPTSLVDTGFPEGFASRVEVRRYGGLTLNIASRYDQIFLKLYAAADQWPGSKHADDLRRWGPPARNSS